jgi:hypothetical protein
VKLKPHSTVKTRPNSARFACTLKVIHEVTLPTVLTCKKYNTLLTITAQKSVRYLGNAGFQLAEVAVSGGLFRRILAAIQRLRAPPVPA